MVYMSFQNVLLTIRNIFLFLLILFFPLFFFPFMRDFLVISKLYFFLYSICIILGIGFVYLIISKRIVLYKNPFSGALVLILIAIILSTILASPNKVQALLSPRFGFFLIFSMSAFFLLVTELFEKKKNVIISLLITSGTIVSFLSIIIAIRPFRSIDLGLFSFLDNPSFNLVGSSIEMGIFLGFVLILTIIQMFHMQGNTEKKSDDSSSHNAHTSHKQYVKQGFSYKRNEFNPLYFVSFVFVTIALFLQFYFVIKSMFFDHETFLITPWGTSWYAAIEILKNPLQTGLFGVGIDNFVAIFTQVKSVSYNMSDLWQITSFNASRSAFLHIFTEGGIVAFIGFLLIFIKVHETFKFASLPARIVIIYIALSLFLWPASLINFFIFFLGLAYYAHDVNKHNLADAYTFDMKKNMPLYITAIVICAVFLGFTYFSLTNVFISEILYGQSIKALQTNNLKDLYDTKRAAIQFNRYNEMFRRDFSQTNLLIAQNFSAKKSEEITEQDKQIITQAIQAAIAESKAAVSLNPYNAVNWQNLAQVYKNILHVAEGAGTWVLTAYQRAIVLDPQNPLHRLELGGVMYQAENYAQAERLFEQAVNLKSDWGNAYYNLAWAKYKQQKYEEAVFNMQKVIALLDAEKDKEDIKKVQEDIEVFRKDLEKQKKTKEGQGEEQNESEKQSSQKESQLNLPEEEEADPIIDLPEDAAPPAEGEEEEVDLDASDVELDEGASEESEEEESQEEVAPPEEPEQETPTEVPSKNQEESQDDTQ